MFIYDGFMMVLIEKGINHGGSWCCHTAMIIINIRRVQWLI